MRQITKDATRAFYGGKPFKRDNTEVITDRKRFAGMEITSAMLLHGHPIARIVMESENRRRLEVTNAGYETSTTKERLNGVICHICPALRLYQKDFEWYWGTGVPFRGCFGRWETLAHQTRSEIPEFPDRLLNGLYRLLNDPDPMAPERSDPADPGGAGFLVAGQLPHTDDD